MIFKVGTRASRLSKLQTKTATDTIEKLVSGVRFQIVTFSSPGDRDRELDLRESPGDFFTRDLDEAVKNCSIDAAIHSAKDRADVQDDSLDWFWLPWKEDRRDVLVLRDGLSIDNLSSKLRIGVSSERREHYARIRFPNSEILSIRGNIEERLAGVDAKHYDAAIFAAAAMVRLGLQHRITELIPLNELPTPEGQGALCMVFRKGDGRFENLRSLFVNAVYFAGAGAGNAANCTLAVRAALECCDICFHDSLIDEALLDFLPPNAARVSVGKRSGAHATQQSSINALVGDAARKGLHVVRLKGGDPGIFGRLAEEIDTLESFRLPYHILPAVSSLNAATTGTGLLLTQRGESRGFIALTPRQQGGGEAPVNMSARCKLPLILFMAIEVCSDLVRQLTEDGLSPRTPAFVVFGAGTLQQEIIESTLSLLTEQVSAYQGKAPGLIIIGANLKIRNGNRHGALGGMRVLLTSSEELTERASAIVTEKGGVAVPHPLIRCELNPGSKDISRNLCSYDWLILTSPSAVRFFMKMLDAADIDIRLVPRIAVSGAATERTLRQYHLRADIVPMHSAEIGGEIKKGAQRECRILRLSSDKADSTISDDLRRAGFSVDDAVLYNTVPVLHKQLPAFDAAVFASTSAVNVFVNQWSVDVLNGKEIVVIGNPTAEALRGLGIVHFHYAQDETIESCIHTLAAHRVAVRIEAYQ
jgi:uroporphyrinogen III methyltransferase/synthase